MKIVTTQCLVVINTVFLLLYCSPVAAVKIGGNGGVATSSIRCASDRLAVGLEVTFSQKIETLRMKCQHYDGNMKWSGGSNWSQFSRTTNPNPSSNKRAVSCQQDKWITGITGDVTNGIVTGLKITCAELYYSDHYNSLGWKERNAQVISILNSRKGTARQAFCKTSSGDVIDNITIKYGWYLDSLKPSCGHITRLPSTPITVSPSLNDNSTKSAPASPSTTFFKVRNRDGDYARFCFMRLSSEHCFLNIEKDWPNNAYSPVGLSLPESLSGEKIRYKVRNCARTGNRVCGDWSAVTTFLVLPKSVSINNLRNGQNLRTRRVTLNWQATNTADSYRVLVLDKSVNNIPNLWREPEMNSISGKRQVVKINRNTNSITINIDPRMQTQVKIKIASCKQLTARDRACNVGSSILRLNLPKTTPRKSR
ncbi:hypothetical protein FLL45_08260 [Aliikangiella marina]|uniref:Uncharacterized protein n=1 Tax=Aliikangiella marina TaxID=1712262 RepID=A0A545TCK0_9GAMM|nr:hypothetical protein [Aliikangiella marina]TQV74942.1 hypothetical protein FLL45_08260 [Aliikangiella marina]